MTSRKPLLLAAAQQTRPGPAQTPSKGIAAGVCGRGNRRCGGGQRSLPGSQPRSFALHDAQLVLARSYGFDSWPKLKAFVDGVTVRGLCDAVRAGDIDGVRAMLAVRPELVHLDVAEDDEHRALHHAVLQRRPEIVRLLMQHGADARQGIWPHRDATSPLTIATERGYVDIVAIIRDEVRRHSRVSTTAADTPVPASLLDAFQRGDEEAMIASLDAHPSLSTHQTLNVG